MSFKPIDNTGPIKISIPSETASSKAKKPENSMEPKPNQFAAVLEDIMKDDIPTFNLPELPKTESAPEKDPLKVVPPPADMENVFPDKSHRVSPSAPLPEKDTTRPVTWSKAELMNYRQTGEVSGYQPSVESPRTRELWDHRITAGMSVPEILQRYEALHDGSVHGNVTASNVHNLRVGIANSPEGSAIIENARSVEDQQQRYHTMRREFLDLGLDSRHAHFIADRTSRNPSYFQDRGNYITSSMLAQAGYQTAAKPVLTASGESTNIYNGSGYAYRTKEGGIGVVSDIGPLLNHIPEGSQIFEYHGRYGGGFPLDRPPQLGASIDLEQYMSLRA